MDQASESVRFLDDVDLTFTLDSRATSFQQMTSIEIMMKPIVFRASYRDINLITSIANTALGRYNQSQQPQKSTGEEGHASDRIDTTTQRHGVVAMQATSSSLPRSVGMARVLMTKEQVTFIQRNPTYLQISSKLKGSFDGFRLILIGDLHEQPMLHLKVKPFIIGAKDWSGEVRHSVVS